MKQKNKSGFTVLVVILVLVALIAAVTVGTYFILTNQKDSAISDSKMVAQDENKIDDDSTDMSSPPPVSESLDLEDIESEIEDTIVASPNQDLLDIESEASGL